MLTAFLIDAYKSLQPDSSVTTNQTLSHISQQMANSSLPPCDPTSQPKFEPDTSFVTINSLWFLSLVSSLAAALYGMMAKQWLRQYLKWTTMSGTSEAQVALRQMRYEALQKWQLPAIIASIPALLEVALILFLIGMDILLWTLNGTVFGVCTAAIAVLILLAFVSTIIPVSCPSCPYKSPAGWACLLSLGAAASGWNKAMDLLQPIMDWLCTNSFVADNHHVACTVWKDWRERDIKLYKSESEVSETANLQMCTLNAGWFDVKREDIDGAATRFNLLHRVFAWISQNSQDIYLLNAIYESVPTEITCDWHPFSRLVFHFHETCHVLQSHGSTDDVLYRLLPRKDCAPVDFGGASDTVVRVLTRDLEESGYQYRILCRSNDDGEMWDTQFLNMDAVLPVPAPLRNQLACILALDLEALLDADDESSTSDLMDMYGRRAAYYFQGTALLAGFLACMTVAEERRPTIAVARLAALVDRLIAGADKLPSLFAPLLPLLLYPTRTCEHRLNRALILTADPELKFAHRVWKHPAGGPETWNQVQCELYRWLSRDALKGWGGRDDETETDERLQQLLDRMIACARRSLTLSSQDESVSTDSSPFSHLVYTFHASCSAPDIHSDIIVPRNTACVGIPEGGAVMQNQDIFFAGCTFVVCRLLEGGRTWDTRQFVTRPLSSVAYVLLAHTIARALTAILDAGEDTTRPAMRKYGNQVAYYLQGSALVGLVLAYSAAIHERRSSIATSSLGVLLDRLVSNADTLPEYFRPLVPLLAQGLRECEALLRGERLFLVSAGRFRLTHLVLKFLTGEPAEWSEVAFVCLSQDALKEWKRNSGDADTYGRLSQLLNRMAACAQRCLVLRLKDCGVPASSFYWPVYLRHLFNSGYEDFCGHHIPQMLYPHALISTLAQLNDNGLITDSDNSDHIQALYQRNRSLSVGPSRNATGLDTSTNSWRIPPFSPSATVDGPQAHTFTIRQESPVDASSLHGSILELDGEGDRCVTSCSPLDRSEPSDPATSSSSRSHSLAPPSDPGVQYGNDASGHRASTAMPSLGNVATEEWPVRL